MSRQSGRTRHKFADANQADIVRDLRAAGVAVYLLGDPLDLLCAINGRWILLEVKNPNVKPPGAAIGLAATKPGGEWHDVELLYPGRARYLRKTQAQFVRDFHEQGGTIAVVYDSVEALAACGVDAEKDHGPVRSTCRACDTPLVMLGES